MNLLHAAPLALLLTGCGTMMMSDAMRSCDAVPRFREYAQCVETTYTKHGREPNSGWAAALHAQFRELAEDVDAKRLTEVQARAAAHRAYLAAVQAANTGRP